MGFSELFTFGIFVESILFFWNWSLGFAPILLYSWYMLVNLINLGFCEKLKILRLVLNPIWGFCSIGLKWMKLACWIDYLIILNCFLTCVIINWSISLKTFKWFKIFFFGFLLETLCSNQFCEFELILNLIYCLSSCIMSFNLFMHHIVLLVLYFLC